MKLSSFTSGRDNNFNLIRILAAFAVLVSHSYPLAMGKGAEEPLFRELGMTLGNIAVDIFFVTSGFLVTSSLLVRQSITEFVIARILRIFPALLAMLLLTVCLLGALFTAMPVRDYFFSEETISYFAKCATLIIGVNYELPGVFGGNPYPKAVNGSLWTLPYEVRMYAILALVWLAAKFTQRHQLRITEGVLIGFAMLGGTYFLATHIFLGNADAFPRLFYMFFLGASFYILKESITLSRRFFIVAIVALAISTANKEIFLATYSISIAYILFYVAYIPSGLIRKYNKFGDYSYGIYIYAFPVQQSFVALISGISVFELMLTSAIATGILAMLSWHLLEKRSLGLRKVGVTKVRRLIFRAS